MSVAEVAIEPPSFVKLTDLTLEVHDDNGEIVTERFLDINRNCLPILGEVLIFSILKTAYVKEILRCDVGAEQFGSGFAIVRADIKGNIDRLDAAFKRDKEKFEDLFNIVLDEVARGQDGLRDSDTKGLLWLKRCCSAI